MSRPHVFGCEARKNRIFLISYSLKQALSLDLNPNLNKLLFENI